MFIFISPLLCGVSEWNWYSLQLASTYIGTAKWAAEEGGRLKTSSHCTRDWWRRRCVADTLSLNRSAVVALPSTRDIHTYIVYYAKSQQNVKRSRQKHTIKRKKEHKTQKDKKYTKLNYKNTGAGDKRCAPPELRRASQHTVVAIRLMCEQNRRAWLYASAGLLLIMHHHERRETKRKC